MKAAVIPATIPTQNVSQSLFGCTQLLVISAVPIGWIRVFSHKQPLHFMALHLPEGEELKHKQ